MNKVAFFDFIVEVARRIGGDRSEDFQAHPLGD